MVYEFFDKKSAAAIHKEPGISSDVVFENQQLAEQLQKSIIRKFEKRKVYLSFKDNIWGADLGDMHLISRSNKGFRFLLCVIDIYSKYAWVVPLKDRKGITITNAIQKIIDESYSKPNKIWVDKGSEFYNRSMKWLQDDTEMYSTHNEGKSVVAERVLCICCHIYV